MLGGCMFTAQGAHTEMQGVHVMARSSPAMPTAGQALSTQQRCADAPCPVSQAGSLNLTMPALRSTGGGKGGAGLSAAFRSLLNVINAVFRWVLWAHKRPAG